MHAHAPWAGMRRLQLAGHCQAWQGGLESQLRLDTKRDASLGSCLILHCVAVVPVAMLYCCCYTCSAVATPKDTIPNAYRAMFSTCALQDSLHPWPLRQLQTHTELQQSPEPPGLPMK